MNDTQLLNENNCLLVIIDIQQRLVAAMPSDIVAEVIKKNQLLLIAAKALAMPVIVTEQYPKGLGSIVAELKDQFNADTTIIEKTSFSCTNVTEFSQKVDNSKRKKIILTGMEAHICVLQTALALQAQNFQVYVVEDAVCSRSQFNQNNAIQRLRDAGVIMTNVESVIFEWLGDARHPKFKELSKLIV